MKKFFSLLLVIAMVATMSVVAFADEAPATKAASGLDHGTVLPPDENGYCWTEFVFSPDVDINGYNAKWGIGWFDAEGNFKYWNPDNDALDNGDIYWSDFTWTQDIHGNVVFRNLFHPKPEQLNAEGETYANLWEKAKDGKIYIFMADYDPSAHTVDGTINCDSNNPELPANALVDGLDANMARAGVAGLEKVVVTAPDADGISKLQFIFHAGIDMTGYEAKWGIGWFDAEGNFKYWNPDSDQSPTSWGDFSWYKNEDGKVVFENIMHPSAEQLNAEGETFASLYEKAASGLVYGIMADYNGNNHPVDGVLNSDAKYVIAANGIVDGLDACFAEATSDYEAPETTSGETEAPATTAPATDAGTGTGAGTDAGTDATKPAEGGCSSMMGFGALILAAALAPVAFKKH